MYVNYIVYNKFDLVDQMKGEFTVKYLSY